MSPEQLEGGPIDTRTDVYYWEMEAVRTLQLRKGADGTTWPARA